MNIVAQVKGGAIGLHGEPAGEVEVPMAGRVGVSTRQVIPVVKLTATMCLDSLMMTRRV